MFVTKSEHYDLSKAINIYYDMIMVRSIFSVIVISAWITHTRLVDTAALHRSLIMIIDYFALLLIIGKISE